MTTDMGQKEGRGAEAKRTKEVTFKCLFCEKSKPLGEMMIITRFFPPMVACRDCEKKLR